MEIGTMRCLYRWANVIGAVAVLLLLYSCTLSGDPVDGGIVTERGAVGLPALVVAVLAQAARALFDPEH